VKRLYRGYKVLQQAESQAGFDPTDRVRNRFYFSHLYTALDQPDFQRFLGIDAETSLRQNPVPKSKLPELQELMVWLFGQEEVNRAPLIRRHNPDLDTLREVICKPAALSALRSGYSLDRAYAIGLGDRHRFRDSLTRAKEDLQQAYGTATTGFSGDRDLWEMIRDILLYAERLNVEMEELFRVSGAGHARHYPLGGKPAARTLVRHRAEPRLPRGRRRISGGQLEAAVQTHRAVAEPRQ
jgi:hypothetical protein